MLISSDVGILQWNRDGGERWLHAQSIAAGEEDRCEDLATRLASMQSSWVFFFFYFLASISRAGGQEMIPSDVGTVQRSSG